MFKACSLSSGSSGNSYYIKAGHDAFLVDAGITMTCISKYLDEIGENLDNIKAVFVTHEHTDHSKGLPRMVQKGIPIYLTKDTFESLGLSKKENIHFIKADDHMHFNGTKITSFSKKHDASDPCSYTFEHGDKKLSVITDIGHACRNVKKNVSDSHAIILESNYDENMLMTGGYPLYLKERINGMKGHLSNYDAGMLVLEHASAELKYVLLSHLSEKNNNPKIALETFNALVSQRKDLKINAMVSKRYGVSSMIVIE